MFCHSGLTWSGRSDRDSARNAILAINGHYLYTAAELSHEIDGITPGTKIAIRYQRSTIYDNYLVVSRAEPVAQNDRTAVTGIYLNSLNETIDLHEKRLAAFENRVPQPIWLLIISVSLIAVFTRGSTLTTRFWLTLVLLPITIAIVVSLIADLDSPSRGLIQLDQRALQRLKADMSTEAEH